MKTKNKILLCIITLFVFVGMLNVRAITTGSETGSDGVSKIITDTATLTVTGVDAGDKLSAYKILDAFYNSSSNVISYEFTDSFQAYLTSESNDLTVEEYFQLSGGNIESGSTASDSELDELASGYAAYIKEHSESGSAMTVSGTTATANLAAGSYLVLPTETLRVYAVMVGNLDYTASGNDWVINNEEIVAKVDDASITKGVGAEGIPSGSYSIGDVVPYVIKGTVPTYPTNATNKTYIIRDTITAGLDFQPVTAIKISDGATALTNSNGTFTNAGGQTVAVAEIQGKNLTITFTVDNLTANNITVEYGAKINSNAVIGGSGNGNKASLEYSNDPYGEGTHNTVDEPDGGEDAVVYIYGLQIFKHAADSTPLEGAEFEIYKDAELENLAATVTTGSDGYAKSTGLAEGTYYVKETKAPTGYQLLTDPIPIKIGPNQTGEEVLQDTDSDGYYELDVANAKVGLLPVTGGVGTIILTLVGLAIVGGAFYFFFVYRKKKQNPETI